MSKRGRRGTKTTHDSEDVDMEKSPALTVSIPPPANVTSPQDSSPPLETEPNLPESPLRPSSPTPQPQTRRKDRGDLGSTHKMTCLVQRLPGGYVTAHIDLSFPRQKRRKGVAGGSREGVAGGSREGVAGGSREGVAGGSREGVAGGSREGVAGGSREGVAGGSREGVAVEASQVEIVPINIRVSHPYIQNIVTSYNSFNEEIAADAPRYRAIIPQIQNYIHKVQESYRKVRALHRMSGGSSEVDRDSLRHNYDSLRDGYYKLQMLSKTMMSAIKKSEIAMNSCVEIAKSVNQTCSNTTPPGRGTLTRDTLENLHRLERSLSKANSYLFQCKQNYYRYEELRDTMNSNFLD